MRGARSVIGIEIRSGLNHASILHIHELINLLMRFQIQGFLRIRGEGNLWLYSGFILFREVHAYVMKELTISRPA